MQVEFFKSTLLLGLQFCALKTYTKAKPTTVSTSLKNRGFQRQTTKKPTANPPLIQQSQNRIAQLA
jgi:hypothetical protein